MFIEMCEKKKQVQDLIPGQSKLLKFGPRSDLYNNTQQSVSDLQNAYEQAKDVYDKLDSSSKTQQIKDQLDTIQNKTSDLLSFSYISLVGWNG
jgi:hypothetical protein